MPYGTFPKMWMSIKATPLHLIQEYNWLGIPLSLSFYCRAKQYHRMLVQCVLIGEAEISKSKNDVIQPLVRGRW